LGEPVGPFAPGRRGNALFLDWETRDETARHRMARLCAALGVPAPALRYLRCEAPLVDCLEHVRREVDRYAIDLVVVDSVALAVGGEVTAEMVLPFQAAARRLGAHVTKLLLSHVSLESVRGKAVARAYGSVFMRNLARRAWEVKRAEKEGPGRYVVALTCEKTNDSDEVDEPLGVRVAFADPDGPVRVAAVSADDVPAIAERMTHAARALRLLRHGPLATAELASELGLTENAARTVLGRLKTDHQVVQLDLATAAGARRRAWGLAAPIEANGREPR
jgi:AAA domain